MSKLKIGKMTLGVCATNCYFLYREGSPKLIVVDPGDSGDRIYEALGEKGFEIEGILLTHGHFDHIWGVNALRKRSGAKVYALGAEKALCEDERMNVSEQAGRAYTVTPDVCLEDGDEITIGEIPVRVIATPGHTEGSCCYYFEEAGFLVCGDTIFYESVGRTDFPTGSSGRLMRSIREKIFVLPDEVQLYPGHGESTTVGHEKEYNPYA